MASAQGREGGREERRGNCAPGKVGSLTEIGSNRSSYADIRFYYRLYNTRMYIIIYSNLNMDQQREQTTFYTFLRLFFLPIFLCTVTHSIVE